MSAQQDSNQPDPNWIQAELGEVDPDTARTMLLLIQSWRQHDRLQSILELVENSTSRKVGLRSLQSFVRDITRDPEAKRIATPRRRGRPVRFEDHHFVRLLSQYDIPFKAKKEALKGYIYRYLADGGPIMGGDAPERMQEVVESDPLPELISGYVVTAALFEVASDLEGSNPRAAFCVEKVLTRVWSEDLALDQIFFELFLSLEVDDLPENWHGEDQSSEEDVDEGDPTIQGTGAQPIVAVSESDIERVVRGGGRQEKDEHEFAAVERANVRAVPQEYAQHTMPYPPALSGETISLSALARRRFSATLRDLCAEVKVDSPIYLAQISRVDPDYIDIVLTGESQELDLGYLRALAGGLATLHTNTVEDMSGNAESIYARLLGQIGPSR